LVRPPWQYTSYNHIIGATSNFVASTFTRVLVEEIFGPLLVILNYETVEEAIAIANDTA
jgi:acyl-CoA reductase-like NAD-dependent aldehyde dehydrogenase